MIKSLRNKPLNNNKKPPKTRASKGDFVFFIGDEGAILCYSENGEVKRRLFSPSATAKPTETLKELLAEYPTASIYFLVDMVEQSYVRHTLPPVSSFGVNKIIQRRLQRDFSADDLKGALSLGKEKIGRKDWNFLLISLAYKDHLRDWCELVYDLPNRFKGVYLSPVESEGTISILHDGLQKDNIAKNKNKFSLPSLKKGSKAEDPGHMRWDIMVVHNKTGGFRQVVLKNRVLIFTRMAQVVGDEKPMVMAGNIEQEIRNTIEYLRRLSFNDHSELNILIIVGQEIKESLSTETFSAHSSTILTPHEAAELIGLEQSILSGDRYTDVLLACSFLKRKNKRLRLLPTYTKKTEACYNQIKLTRVFGTLAMLALFAFCAANVYQLINSETTLNDVTVKGKALLVRVNEFEDKAKTFKVDPFVVDSLIKTQGIISNPSADFRSIIARLLPLISENITLQSFDWVTTDLNLNPKAANTVPKAATPNDSATVNTGNTEAQTKSTLLIELLHSGTENSSAAEESDKVITELKKSFSGYVIETLTSGANGAQGGGEELTINFEAEKTTNAAALNRKTILNLSLVGSDPIIKKPDGTSTEETVQP